MCILKLEYPLGKIRRTLGKDTEPLQVKALFKLEEMKPERRREKFRKDRDRL